MNLRAGTYIDFRDRMLSRLSGSEHPGLEGLRTRDARDFSLGLVDAWAMVGDVLTFYQERIGHEGYLRTAIEPESLRLLAAMIGYEPARGVAATTEVAFTVETSPGASADVRIEPGTRVQSVPARPNELPQTFETRSLLLARPEWNALRARQTRPQILEEAATEAWLETEITNLKAGDGILFVTKERDLDPKEGRAHFARILTVVGDREARRTHVTWDAPLPANVVSDTAEYPKIHLLRTRAAIFGHNAQDWRPLPDATKANYLGLPSPSDLAEREKKEWPEFKIFAPVYPPTPRAVTLPDIIIQPTAKSVAEAAIEAANRAADAARDAAFASIPEAGQKIVTAVTTAIDAVTFTAKEAFDGLTAATGAANPIDPIAMAAGLQSVVQGLQNLLGTVTIGAKTYAGMPAAFSNDPFTDIIRVLSPWGFGTGAQPITGVSKLIDSLNTALGDLRMPTAFGVTVDQTAVTANLTQIALGLKEIFDNSPLALPMAILDNMRIGPIGDPLSIQGRFQTALMAFDEIPVALKKIPEAFAAAAGARLTAEVVEKVVKLVLDAPDPFPAATPEDVAFMARVAAEAGTLLVEFLPVFIAASAAGTLSFAGLIALATGATATAATVAAVYLVLMFCAGGYVGVAVAAVAAAEILLLAGPFLLMPAFFIAGAALLLPILVTIVVALVLLAPAAIGGSKEVARAVNDAVTLALIPKKLKPPPRFAPLKLRTDTIDLDAVYPRITADGWAVLANPERFDAFKVFDVVESSRAQFTLTGKTSRVTLSGRRLKRFAQAVRATSVFAESQSAELAEVPIDPVYTVPSDDVDGSGRARVWLDAPAAGLAPGRLVILSGPTTNGTATAHLTSIASAAGDVLVLEDKIPDDVNFNRAALTIAANVMTATHGDSREEVLGSGDGSMANQTFALRETPLTYVVSAGAERGAESTLDIHVDGIRWREVVSLHGCGPRDRVYSTHLSPKGKVIVRFGDGISGARLPSGSENVIARYRVGIGRDGNVTAGQLRTPLTRPLGLQSAVNIRDAYGAADLESRDAIRGTAPGSVLTLGRAVSVRDYQDIARTFGGIAKAHAAWEWTGGVRSVFLTLAGPEGRSVEGETLAALKGVFVRTGIPGVRVRTADYVHSTFGIGGKVWVASDRRIESVAAAVREALTAAFSFDARRLGQPVSLSEVLAVIHGVNGVSHVDIDTLSRAGNDVEHRLAAFVPGNGGGNLEPAELLTIAQDGLDQLEFISTREQA